MDVDIFYFLASCGIPFQVLPDYQEGAEQVRQWLDGCGDGGNDGTDDTEDDGYGDSGYDIGDDNGGG